MELRHIILLYLMERIYSRCKTMYNHKGLPNRETICGIRLGGMPMRD